MLRAEATKPREAAKVLFSVLLLAEYHKYRCLRMGCVNQALLSNQAHETRYGERSSIVCFHRCSSGSRLVIALEAGIHDIDYFWLRPGFSESLSFCLEIDILD
jgi:hypothetical protein